MYISGYFTGTTDFDPGVGVFTMTTFNISTGTGTGTDAYIVKLDANGNFIFATKIGGSGNDYISNILISPSGKIIVKGFAGTGGINKSTAAIAAGPFLASYTQPALANNQFELDQNISVYPNPTSGNYNITINENLISAKVTVYNLLGQKVKGFSLDILTTNQNLDAGMYLLEIEKEGVVTTKKLLVN